MTIEPYKETETIRLSIHDKAELEKTVDKAVAIIEEYFNLGIKNGEEHMFVGFICDGFFVSHFLEGNQIHILQRVEIDNTDGKVLEEFVKDIIAFGQTVQDRVRNSDNISAEMILHENLVSFRLKLPEMIQAAMS